MKTTLLSIVMLAFSSVALGQAPSYSDESFCRDRQDRDFVKDLTMDSSNLMTMRNHGGILNSGVCWWHSRFQRNALYLTIYKPALDKPDQNEVVRIIKKIRAAREVVTIPGYRNFAEFSYDNEALIQRELEKWQKGDGIIYVGQMPILG